MLERIRYVNSAGEALEFGANGIYVNENDLRDWTWSYSTEYSKIRNLTRKRDERTLPVRIWAESEQQGLALKNRLHDITEVDVVAGVPGRLYVGDWYISCYVVGSAKSDYLASKRILAVDLTLAVESGSWYSSQVISYSGRTSLESAVVGEALVGFAQVGSTGGEDIGGTLYPYDYDYPRAYAFSTQADYLVNDCAAPCSWKLTVHGPAANPAVTIGDTVHKLQYVIPAGAYVEIDSRERTITMYSASGATTNLFRFRDKVDDVFALIPSGTHWIRWNGDYVFSLELYKERSEPRWT